MHRSDAGRAGPTDIRLPRVPHEHRLGGGDPGEVEDTPEDEGMRLADTGPGRRHGEVHQRGEAGLVQDPVQVPVPVRAHPEDQAPPPQFLEHRGHLLVGRDREVLRRRIELGDELLGLVQLDAAGRRGPPQAIHLPGLVVLPGARELLVVQPVERIPPVAVPRRLVEGESPAREQVLRQRPPGQGTRQRPVEVEEHSCGLCGLDGLHAVHEPEVRRFSRACARCPPKVVGSAVLQEGREPGACRSIVQQHRYGHVIRQKQTARTLRHEST